MVTKRLGDNPQLAALAGTEMLAAQSIAGGTTTSSGSVAAGGDVSIPVRELVGLRVTAVTIVSSTATVNCGFGLVRNFTLSLTGNATLALSNLAAAGYVTEGEIRIAQDATGRRTLTLPSSFKPLGGSDTAIAAAANAVTILSFKTFNAGTTFEYAMQEVG